MLELADLALDHPGDGVGQDPGNLSSHVGCDAGGQQTHCEWNESEQCYILNGEKKWATSGATSGLFTVMAIQNQDLPEILGVTMLAAFFIVIANLVVDILYAVLDPRVRY